jgi:hypothetical protein
MVHRLRKSYCFACGAPTSRKGKVLYGGEVKMRYACPFCYPHFERHGTKYFKKVARESSVV